MIDKKETKKMIVVGVGELGITDESPSDVKTFALGSCVGVIMFNSGATVVGLLHVQLPERPAGIDEKKELITRYADTGIPMLIEQFKKKYKVDLLDLKTKLVGGSAMGDPNGVFNIGKRNILAVKKVLWKHGIPIVAQDLGGDKYRTVSISVGSPVVTIAYEDQKWSI